MDELDKEILMKLQYDFPIDIDPYGEIADILNIDKEKFLNRLIRLRNEGIIKRIGFYYNFRSQGKEAALIAFESGENYRKIAEIMLKDPSITHSYLRNHPRYNIWIVAKKESNEELIELAEKIMKYSNSKSYVVLLSKRTYKLSVKYDLFEGISKAGKYASLPENPPLIKDMGVPEDVVKFVRNLPINESPYDYILRKYKYSKQELTDLLNSLLKNGILADPGASLDGEKLGFKENGMIVMEPNGNEEKLCHCAAKQIFSTHVVLRRSIPEWRWKHNCYAMVHAISKDKIESIANNLKSECKPNDIMIIYSLEDLKPGVVR
ncbi:MAG: Lrp/AsnC family transcriptional regulator [Caldisphaera sp.]|jgi:DNA-binding Lrp family transcriptional regulator|nr:Lrp/AsnC family transcriptional regulator [Caldisphaera sp.]PMP60190.1 MAG: Lrp/AsnC family transcriptional regulator [Caldisphaera sp.]